MGLNDFIYVADCVAVTKEMLQGIAGEGEDETGIEALKDEMGMFVLVTNAMALLKLEPADVLKEYKEQVSVETCFRVLKDLVFI